MKNIKQLLLIASLLISGNIYAATITWQASSTNVFVGDTFTINVVGTDFTSNVDGGGINIGYNNNIVNVLSVSINESIWDFGGLGINTGTIDNTAGTLDGIMVNTFNDVIGDFTVATIEMQAISSGSSMLSLSEFGLNPWASGGSMINPDFVNGTVNVSSVPLPASIWLLGCGLVTLFGIAKNKSRC